MTGRTARSARRAPPSRRRGPDAAPAREAQRLSFRLVDELHDARVGTTRPAGSLTGAGWGLPGLTWLSATGASTAGTTAPPGCLPGPHRRAPRSPPAPAARHRRRQRPGLRRGLAPACDIRLAAPEARFTQFIKVGIGGCTSASATRCPGSRFPGLRADADRPGRRRRGGRAHRPGERGRAGRVAARPGPRAGRHDLRLHALRGGDDQGGDVVEPRRAEPRGGHPPREPHADPRHHRGRDGRGRPGLPREAAAERRRRTCRP